MEGSAVTLRTPARRAAARAPPPRPLQRLQRARRGCRRARARRRAGAHRHGPGRMRGRLRPGRDDRDRRQAALDPPDQEPGRRQRGAAHPAARGRASQGLDLWIGLNDRIADGRDVSWIWDADFELLAGAVRRVVCAGTRAPEMAAAAQVRRLAGGGDRGRAGDRALARRAPSPRPPAASSPCPPTRPCSSCASCSPTAAWPRSSGDERQADLGRERGERGDLARSRVRRLHSRPAPLGGACRRARGPILELGCGTGRVDAAPGQRGGHLVVGVDRDRGAGRGGLGTRRQPGPAGDAEHRRRARLRALRRVVRLALAPMQLIQLLGGPRGAHRLPAPASTTTSYRRARRPSRSSRRCPSRPPRKPRRRCPTCTRSMAGSTRACRWAGLDADDDRRSAACARPLTRTAS